MSDPGAFSHLLSPVEIGGIRLPNRIAKAPQDTHFVGLDGHVEDRVVALYEALARGGVGLIFLASVPPIAMAPEARQIAIWGDEFIPGLARVASAVHDHGSRIFVQLNHGGPAEVDHYPSGRAWSASTLEQDELPSPLPHFKPVRGLSIEEINAVETAYVDGAVRAHEAGYDGVEVHAAHTYMLGCFLTRIWNRREDEYGAHNAENRTRIVVNIIQGIRSRLGPDFPIGVRINGREWGAPGALSIEEAVANAKVIDAAGVAYISVSGYGHGPVPFKYVPDYWRYPEPQPDMEPFVALTKDEGLLLPAAAAVKQAVDAPVIGVGGLTAESAEQALASGRVDIVALGRALWADPDLANKLASGRAADIRPCTRCATCEVSPRKCRVNAALGSVDDYVLRPAPTPKRVVVIGGGPAGMEAARVAAERGHHVTLFEKERRLGGLVPLAVTVKGTETEDIVSFIEYLQGQLQRLGVTVHLGTTADRDRIAALRPDVVVVATGGVYELPAIPGISKRIVSTAADLGRRARLPLRIAGPDVTRRLTKVYLPFGKRVIVIGGRIEGAETAEFLIKRGRRVTIVDHVDDFGRGMPERLLMRLRAWMADNGTPIYTGVHYREITDAGLRFVTRDGEEMTVEADDIVVALPQGPNPEPARTMEGVGPEIHTIGPMADDEPWLIVDAVAAGFKVGSTV
jgi:2,4-dienoyl-CoA reductase (NADPH2)